MPDTIKIICAMCRRTFEIVPPPDFDGVKPYAQVVKESKLVCWDCWKWLSQRKR